VDLSTSSSRDSKSGTGFLCVLLLETRAPSRTRKTRAYEVMETSPYFRDRAMRMELQELLAMLRILAKKVYMGDVLHTSSILSIGPKRKQRTPRCWDLRTIILV
jgi:hypothetical protein